MKYLEHVKNVMKTRADDANAGMALRKTEKDIELALADCKNAHTKLLEILREATRTKRADLFIVCYRSACTSVTDL